MLLLRILLQVCQGASCDPVEGPQAVSLTSGTFFSLAGRQTGAWQGVGVS